MGKCHVLVHRDRYAPTTTLPLALSLPLGSVFTSSSGSRVLSPMAAPVVDAAYLKEIDKARRELRALIASKNYAPIMLRLA